MRLRETYSQDGPGKLSDTEILALVLGTGTRGSNALSVAATLLERFDGVHGLQLAEPQELAGTHGIGPAQAIRLHAAMQLGRRSLCRLADREICRTATDAYGLLAPGLLGLADEELHGLFLDRRRCLIARRVLTRGSHAFTIVDPRQIYRIGLKLGATAVILGHNHPSGNPEPSQADREVTAAVAHAGRILRIPLLDHLVVSDCGWTSLAQEGGLPRHLGTEQTLWTA